MPFEKVVDISEAAILQSVLLLLVSAVEDRAEQVIRLLPLNDKVEDLISVEPDKVADG
jgi:hypothetical protein